MNYTKPEVTILGEAAKVIANVIPFKPPTSLPLDGPPRPKTNPAYDLDE